MNMHFGSLDGSLKKAKVNYITWVGVELSLKNISKDKNQIKVFNNKHMYICQQGGVTQRQK